LFAQVTKITAYDKSHELMRQLESSEKIEKVTDGSHTALPFDNELFDIVICRFVFHHLDDKAKALKEVNRVLREDGALLLSDPILPQHSRDVLNGIYRIREDNFHGYCSYHELIDLLEENGFLPIRIRPFHVRYASLHKYLEAVENGIKTGDSSTDTSAIVPVLKGKIARALNFVDETVRREMKVTGSGLDLSFQYDLVDIASVKCTASKRL